MGYSLMRAPCGDPREDQASFNTKGWSTVLALAEDHGWHPLAPLAPLKHNEQTEGKWNGNYSMNDWQNVTAEDAAGMADAIEKALESPSVTWGTPTWRKIVVEFAAFCRRGGFLIG